MPLTEDTVREQLKKVIDPELFVNIVDLGLIYVVDIVPCDTTTNVSAGSDSDHPPSGSEPGSGQTFDVNIEMTMTSPMCPAGPQLVAESKQFVGELEQVNHVEVKVVMDPPWSPDRMTDDARDQLGIF